jgi:hypothetical protein
MDFSLTSYWNYGTKYCSIEHCSNAEGESSIYALVALKKNGEFEIKKTYTGIYPDKIRTKLKKNQHSFLILTGNQVLIRATSTSGNDAKIIGSAFPNIDNNDFYYQILKSASQNFVAVCRKDYVQNIIKIYKENNLEIIGFSLGFFTIQNLLQLFKEEAIQLATYAVTIADHEITTYQKMDPLREEENYLLEDTRVSSNFLLPLAGLFSYECLPFNVTSNVQEANYELRKEHRQKVFFRKALLLGTGLCLTALLINFILFSNYHSNYQNLSEKYQAELFQKQAYDEKLSEISDKEITVKNILNNSSSKSTYFLNRLIKSKPGSIILSEFTYQPLERPIKEREAIELNENKVHISGDSGNEAEFSNWIKTLEEMVWIKEIEVAGFSYKSRQNSGFSIIVTLNEDETGN